MIVELAQKRKIRREFKTNYVPEHLQVFWDNVVELGNQLNEKFRSSGFDFSFGIEGYQFARISQNWATIFVKDTRAVDEETGENENLQVGKITVERGPNNEVKIYYYKSYKPWDYEFSFYEDVIWVSLEYLLEFDATPSNEEIDDALVSAYLERNRDLQERKIWRLENPLRGKKKKRRALQGKNLKGLFHRYLIGWC